MCVNGVTRFFERDASASRVTLRLHESGIKIRPGRDVTGVAHPRTAGGYPKGISPPKLFSQGVATIISNLRKNNIPPCSERARNKIFYGLALRVKERGAAKLGEFLAGGS